MSFVISGNKNGFQGNVSEKDTARKTTFSTEDFFSKCDQIIRKLWIWSHLLKKSSMENFVFCAVREVVAQLNCKLKTIMRSKEL